MFEKHSIETHTHQVLPLRPLFSYRTKYVCAMDSVAIITKKRECNKFASFQ